MRRKRSRLGSGARGFTLIELLMVMAIMGILASLLIGAYQGAKQSMRKRLAVADLERLANACEMYKGFHGPVPMPDADDTENQEIYEQLQYMGDSGGVLRRTRPLHWNNERRNSAGSMLDPWGKPYIFKQVEIGIEGELREDTTLWDITHDCNDTGDDGWDQLVISGMSEFTLVPGESWLKIWNDLEHPANLNHIVIADAVKFVAVEGGQEHLFSPLGALKPEFEAENGTVAVNRNGGYDHEILGPLDPAFTACYAWWQAQSGNRGSATYTLPASAEEGLYEVLFWHRSPASAGKEGTPDAPYTLRYKPSVGTRPAFRIYSCGPNGVDNDAAGDDIVRDVTTE